MNQPKVNFSAFPPLHIRFLFKILEKTFDARFIIFLNSYYMVFILQFDFRFRVKFMVPSVNDRNDQTSNLIVSKCRPFLKQVSHPKIIFYFFENRNTFIQEVPSVSFNLPYNISKTSASP